MTARAEYTADEWVLLLTTPQSAAMAVAFADGAGLFETIGEISASAVAQAAGARAFPGNELIAALLANTERIDPARLPQPQAVGEDPAEVVERLRALAVERCEQAAALLEQRSHPTEAAGYAEWVMSIARAAATAVRHRAGLFAPAGPLVDGPERSVLEQLAAALGVEVGELPEEPGEPGFRAADAGPGSSAEPIHPE